jgi:hypothetical protein
MQPRPQAATKSGRFSHSDALERHLDLSVAAQLMGNPLGRPLSAIPVHNQTNGMVVCFATK